MVIRDSTPRRLSFCSNCVDSLYTSQHLADEYLCMLTRLYIEALLVDKELADQVWEAWDKGEIDD